MKISEALILFREFPECRINDYLKEGDIDIITLLKSYDIETVKLKLYRILGKDDYEKQLFEIKTMFIEYMYELSQVYKDYKEENKEETIQIKPPSEYKQIIQLIVNLGKLNIDYTNLTILDGYTCITAGQSKSVEQLQLEVKRKIEDAKGHARVRREQIWNQWTEEQRTNKDILQHFIDSKDI
jgi:hypothetical protein